MTADWSQRLTGKPLLPLRAWASTATTARMTEVLLLGDIQAGLLRGQRFVLEGPAGRGKTTTLIQIAELLYAGATAIAFLIELFRPGPLPETAFLSPIAGMPQLQRRRIDAATLARVSAAEHFSFLLNGWN